MRANLALCHNPNIHAFNHLSYCLFCLSIIGCGASLLLIPVAVVINEEFTDRRSVAMGIASTGGSVGNIILPQFALWCIEKYGWRGSFILLGGLCLQGVIAGVLFCNAKKLKANHTFTISGATYLLFCLINVKKYAKTRYRSNRNTNQALKAKTGNTLRKLLRIDSVISVNLY